MADLYKSSEGMSFWPDAYPAPEAPIPEPEPAPVPEPIVMPEPQVTEHFHKADVTFNMRMAGSSEPVQNAPMVQPLVIVPYVSQMQPLYQFTPEGMKAAYENGTYMPQQTGMYAPYGGYGYGAYPQQQIPQPAPQAQARRSRRAPVEEEPVEDFAYDFEDANVANYDDFNDFAFAEEDGSKVKKAKATKEGKKRGANGTAIAALIFCLITIAFLVISYFEFLPENIVSLLYIMKNQSLISLIMGDLIEGIQAETFDIMPILPVAALAVSALFIILTCLTSLFSVAARRYPMAGTVFAWLAFAFAVFGVVWTFIKSQDDINIGAYIVVGLSALIMIITLIRKRAKA